MPDLLTLVPRDEYLASQRRDSGDGVAGLGPIERPLQRQELADFAASLGPLFLPDVPEDVSRRRESEELAAFASSLGGEGAQHAQHASDFASRSNMQLMVERRVSV